VCTHRVLAISTG